MQSGKQKTALGAVLNERLLQAEGGKNKEIIINKKADWLLQGYFLLGDGRYPSGRLPI